MTLKLCTYAGCNEVVNHADDNTSPRCAKHSLSAPRKRYTHHEDAGGRNLYRSTRWKRLRRGKLSLNPICERCEAFGKAVEAKIVDHIVEIEDGGEFFDPDNLQSLCHACHNRKTGKEKRKRNAVKSEYPTLSQLTKS